MLKKEVALGLASLCIGSGNEDFNISYLTTRKDLEELDKEGSLLGNNKRE